MEKVEGLIALVAPIHGCPLPGNTVLPSHLSLGLATLLVWANKMLTDLTEAETWENTYMIPYLHHQNMPSLALSWNPVITRK